VVRECADVPIAGLSTGTNNAFPELREPTITGMAVGLYASGRVAAADAIVHNKRLDVRITDDSGRERRDIAIVDAVISHERFVGARALWKTENLGAAYVTFADPQAIGLSAIAGLLQPVGRRESGGLEVQLADDGASARVTLRAPIAPGMVKPVGVASWGPMRPGEPHVVRQRAGVVALDGERELAFDENERITITLVDNAFPTVDVARCMHAAAAQGLTRLSPNPIT
jgi:predicted polyphosphate/ATP-dependent NAD kinase